MNSYIKMSQYSQALYDITNKSGLDIGTIYFIVKNFFNDVTRMYEDKLKESYADLQPDTVTVITSPEELGESYTEVIESNNDVEE